MGPVHERVDALTEKALTGDRGAIARLLSILDDQGPRADVIAAQLAARSGRALVVGITGVPGGGKSTLVSALLGIWLDSGKKVAVVAVDPSSPISGGAVLGDRVRMGTHAHHPDVFIRSLSARGQSGGLSRSARSAVDCFDASGFDYVIVETVGAGQSEIDIAAVADARVVVCPPGLGDDVQAIKAGILEIADVIAVSKGDLPLAKAVAGEMRDMIKLRSASTRMTKVPVVVVSAQDSVGIDVLAREIDLHVEANGRGRRLQKPRAEAEATSASNRPAPDGAKTSAHPAPDPLCETLGIGRLAGAASGVEVVMTVDQRHLNINGVCHGGAIFTLADTAFGLASNLAGPMSVGIDAHITFQTEVRCGDVLLARATEIKRGKRLGVYRVDVMRKEADGNETSISAFTGTVYIK